MLLRSHGVRISEVELSMLCRLDPAGGIDPEILLEVVERFGLRAEAQTATVEELRTFAAATFPGARRAVPLQLDHL